MRQLILIIVLLLTSCASRPEFTPTLEVYRTKTSPITAVLPGQTVQIAEFELNTKHTSLTTSALYFTANAEIPKLSGAIFPISTLNISANQTHCSGTVSEFGIIPVPCAIKVSAKTPTKLTVIATIAEQIPSGTPIILTMFTADWTARQSSYSGLTATANSNPFIVVHTLPEFIIQTYPKFSTTSPIEFIPLLSFSISTTKGMIGLDKIPILLNAKDTGGREFAINALMLVRPESPNTVIAYGTFPENQHLFCAEQTCSATASIDMLTLPPISNQDFNTFEVVAYITGFDEEEEWLEVSILQNEISWTDYKPTPFTTSEQDYMYFSGELIPSLTTIKHITHYTP